MYALFFQNPTELSSSTSSISSTIRKDKFAFAILSISSFKLLTNLGNYTKQRTIATFSNLQSFKTSLQFLRNRPQYIHWRRRRTRITNAQVIYHKTNINNPYPKWTKKIPPTYLFGTAEKKETKTPFHGNINSFRLKIHQEIFHPESL